MRKKLFTVNICFMLVVSMMVSFNVSAAGVSTKPDKLSDENLLSQIEESLLNSTPVEREKLLEKASYAGITSKDLADISLSDREVAILEQKISIAKPLQPNKRILKAPSYSPSVAGATLYSATSMPDYALWPDIYMQEQGTWCRAGVIQTVLMYIKGSSPSQQTIINNCAARLPSMAEYINQYKPDEYASYLYTKYGGDQEEFNRCLAYDVLHYQPLIFAMKNTRSTENWPYKTGGHYAICAGYLTWANNEYFIGDPFYFPEYVTGAKGDGYHNKTWFQLNTVITESHGEGDQHIVW